MPRKGHVHIESAPPLSLGLWFAQHRFSLALFSKFIANFLKITDIMAPIEPDMTLLAELYEEIERNPPAIEARKLLVEVYIKFQVQKCTTDLASNL